MRGGPAALVLEDGTAFHGTSFGAEGETLGEAVFNTGMSGYQEVLTDPSYAGQVVAMTSPHQGNYGLNDADDESLGGPKVAGFIVHEQVSAPSNHTSKISLPDYLEKHNVPGLSGVDTRALTLHLRSKGAMRGLILSLEERASLGNDAAKVFAKYPSFLRHDLIREVTTKKPYWFSEKGAKTVVAVDFGVKLNLLREIAAPSAPVPCAIAWLTGVGWSWSAWSTTPKPCPYASAFCVPDAASSPPVTSRICSSGMTLDSPWSAGTNRSSPHHTWTFDQSTRSRSGDVPSRR